MKRALDEEEFTLPSLQTLVLFKLTTMFPTEEALFFYLALVPSRAVRILIETAWRSNKSLGDMTTHHQRITKVELVVHFLNSRILKRGGEVISQTKSTITRSIHLDSACVGLAQLAQEKAAPLCIQPSKVHRSNRFTIY